MKTIKINKSKSKKSIISIKNKKKQIGKGIKRFTLFKPLNGIHIGNEIIKKISGPISFYYLKPIKVKEEGIDFPLIILFGDLHDSRETMCTPCNNAEGCYQIYDASFLKLLDEISPLNKPVDLYFEDFKVNSSYENESILFDDDPLNTTTIYEKFNSNSNKNININLTPPLHIFQQLYGIPCFTHIRRDITPISKKCPTTNIRWQYGDVRFCDNCIETIIDKWTLDKKLTRNEDKIKNALDKMIKNFNKTRDHLELSTMLFIILNTKNSLIIKQFKKQSFPPFKDIQFWINISAQSLIHSIEIQYFTIKEAINLLLVDIYTIMRIMKQPNKTHIQSTLCIGYFGHSHILDMVNIFTKYLNYTIEYQIEENNENRCLEITESINLTKDIEEHNRIRDSF